MTSGFKCKTMSAGLPAAFLEPLCSISLMEDSELRQLVLEILHNIIDRHDNRAKLRGIRYFYHFSVICEFVFLMSVSKSLSGFVLIYLHMFVDLCMLHVYVFNM